MAEKISVYVSEEMHRLFKAAASLQGKTLSEFMVDAASRALHNPSRKAASVKMDQVRESIETNISAAEIKQMRDEGRKY